MGRKRKSRGRGDGGSPVANRTRKTAKAATPTRKEDSSPNSDMDEPQVDHIVKVELESDPEEHNNQQELCDDPGNPDLAPDPDIEIGEVNLMRPPKVEPMVQDEDHDQLDSNMTTMLTGGPELMTPGPYSGRLPPPMRRLLSLPPRPRPEWQNLGRRDENRYLPSPHTPCQTKAKSAPSTPSLPNPAAARQLTFDAVRPTTTTPIRPTTAPGTITTTGTIHATPPQPIMSWQNPGQPFRLPQSAVRGTTGGTLQIPAYTRPTTAPIGSSQPPILSSQPHSSSSWMSPNVPFGIRARLSTSQVNLTKQNTGTTTKKAPLPPIIIPLAPSSSPRRREVPQQEEAKNAGDDACMDFDDELASLRTPPTKKGSKKRKMRLSAGTPISPPDAHKRHQQKTPEKSNLTAITPIHIDMESSDDKKKQSSPSNATKEQRQQRGDRASPCLYDPSAHRDQTENKKREPKPGPSTAPDEADDEDELDEPCVPADEAQATRRHSLRKKSTKDQEAKAPKSTQKKRRKGKDDDASCGTPGAASLGLDPATIREMIAKAVEKVSIKLDKFKYRKALKTEKPPLPRTRARARTLPWPCEFATEGCAHSFTDLTEYEHHLAYHYKPGDHVCDECGKGYHTDKALKRHQKTHEKKIKRKVMFGCQRCGAQYLGRDELYVHMRRNKNHASEYYNIIARDGSVTEGRKGEIIPPSLLKTPTPTTSESENGGGEDS